jgi:hypothetical protein
MEKEQRRWLRQRVIRKWMHGKDRVCRVEAWQITVVAYSACAICLIGGILGFTAVAQASFGIAPGSVTATALNRDGTIDSQAGSHPYSYTFGFSLNQGSDHEAEGDLRDVEIDLPRGLVGYPSGTPLCSTQDFEEPKCAGETQVGIIEVEVGGLGTISGPLYNLVPPPGVPLVFGFGAAGYKVLLEASVRTGEGYGVVIAAHNIPVGGVKSVAATIWGVPASEGHDSERTCFVGGQYVHGCSTEAPEKPFITLPSSCNGPLVTTVKADSGEDPGVLVEGIGLSLDAGGNPVGLFGCERLQFDPSIVLQTTTGDAASPTGLLLDLGLPGPESAEGLAEADLKSTVVTLPAGVAVNPSSANGLQVCGAAQIDLSGPRPAECPDASKIGTVEIMTPLLERPLQGSVYVAAQNDNPFDSLLAFYISGDEKTAGVVIKLAGHVELGGEAAYNGLQPGQLRISLIESPEIPITDLKLDLFGGERALLVTPPTCGAFKTTTTLTPWTAPEEPTDHPTDTFQLISGPNGSGCVEATTGEPSHPRFEAGTIDNQAGASSSFGATFSRQDGEQAFEGFTITTPPGLLGVLKNVARCPEPQAQEGDCGSESQIGETTVAVGAGTDPYWIAGGKVYLTGPYNGGPFGLAIVIPTITGPFTLTGNGGPGKEIVRASIRIDPHTLQLTIVSAQFPTILEGIPLQIKTVNVTLNRPGFLINPTSCAPSSVNAAVTSFQQNVTTAVSSPFEAVNCANLPFKPSITASTQSKPSKADGASLTVKIIQKQGEANLRGVDLQLPAVLPARLTTLQSACTEAQFDIDPAQCPPPSDIGIATAHTTMLSVPLAGPVYLVSRGRAGYPSIALVLQGEGFTVMLSGEVNVHNGVTYPKFETLPDVPISSFELNLPRGPHSALGSFAGSLCGRNLKIPASVVAQNGAVVRQVVKITVIGCPKPRVLTRAERFAKAEKACQKDRPKARHECYKRARAKYGPIREKAIRKRMEN